MSPANEDVTVAPPVESFCEEASSVVLAFEVMPGGRDGERDTNRDTDGDFECTRYKMRMGFKACYKPPIVTFRFHVNIFGHGDSGKNEKTTLYFDVPRNHISSLEQTHHVDTMTTSELDQDDLQQLAGGVTRVRFLLKRPGNLVQPIRELSLKPASQRTLASMTLLAAALEFVLFMPHTTLSKEQFRCLQQAVISPASLHDQQQQDREYGWWLGALYGGVGGKLVNIDRDAVDNDDMSTASESGESTIATATPPAYRRSSRSNDEDFAATAAEPSNEPRSDDLGDGIAMDSPPPYNLLESEAGNPTPAADMKGKQPGKRLRDSEDLDAKLYRRRLVSPPRPVDDGPWSPYDVAETSCLEKQQASGLGLRDPVALVLAKLDQVLKRAQNMENENRSLKAELCAIRENQERINVKLEEMVHQNHQHAKTTQDLEHESADLNTRITNLEDRQAELEDRQGKTEEKCETIEIEITDQVHEALRNRLIGALETM